MRRDNDGDTLRGFGAGFYAFSPRHVALSLLLVAALLFGGAGTAAAAQQGAESTGAIRVQPSEQLFVTLCALYAAGYPKLPSNVSPQLQQVVLRMTALNDPTVAALRAFYRQHRLPNPTATLSRYVSFAMVVGPPPGFEYVVPTEGVPPDVRDLDGFQKVLGEFYLREHMGQLWQSVQPYYQTEADRFRGPVSQVVTVATAYTRRMNRFGGSRTFTVNVDPLIGSITNFRIYSERYEIAVNPAVPGTMDRIRHAFLHFLLDPLTFNAPGVVDKIQYLQFYARKAPRLPEQYKYDFLAFTDECFVRAVELHLRRPTPPKLAGLLEQDDRDGYVLVRPFYYGLDAYESSQLTLARYFPKLLGSIDVKTEGDREAHIAFAPAGNEPVTPKEAEVDQIARLLDQGSQDIATGQQKKAIEIFQNVLKLDPKNTRATYGLAVASALTNQGERAHQLFQQIVDTPPNVYVDPSVLAWSHIYLGRMSDLAGRRQDAVRQYHAALAVKGLPAAAREAAESGVKEPYTPGMTNPEKTPHP